MFLPRLRKMLRRRRRREKSEENDRAECRAFCGSVVGGRAHRTQRDRAVSPMDEDQENLQPHAVPVPSLGAAFASLQRQRPQVPNPVGRASNFNELDLHCIILICASSLKTHQKLESWIGLPAREVRVAQMEPLLGNGRIEHVVRPSLGSKIFILPVSILTRT